MSGPGRDHAAALIALTLLAAVVAAPAVAGRRALGPESILDWDPLYRREPEAARPIASDYTPINQHYPRDLAFARGLHEGRIDLWNPLASAGTPLWAEQGGPFFPLKLPFYVSPSPATYDVYLALRLVLAGFGAYALARRRGLTHGPALAAAAGFELCGGSISSLPFGAGSPLYVLPWVLLGALAIARSRSARAVAGAGIALGVTASGGHPTMIVMLFAAFACAAAAHAAAAWRTPRVALTIAVACGAAVLLGLLLAAPSLLPLAELARFGSSYKSRLAGALMWRWQLVESRMTLPIALFAPGTFHFLHPHLQTLFGFAPAIGMLALVLAVAGILLGGLDAALVATAMLGIALAAAPPGLDWLHQLPGLRLVLPTYPWPLVTLALTQAAGHAVERLGDPRARRAVGLAFVAVLIGASSLLLVGDPPNGPKLFATPLAAASAGIAGALRLVLPPLFAAAALALAVALRRPRQRGCVLAALIALELSVELVPLTWNPPTRVLDGEPSRAVRFLGEHLSSGEARMIALPVSVGYPLTPMLFGLADFRGSAPLPVARYQEYLQTLSRGAAQFVNQDVPVARSPLLDAAAARYVVFARAGLDEKPRDLDAVQVFPPVRPPLDDPEMPAVHSDEYVVVFENRHALPRARIVHRFVAVRDRAEARQRLGRWKAEDERLIDAEAREAVILEPDENGRHPAALGSAAAGDSVAIADATDPDRLVLEARLASDGLLVLADTYYPGWTASLDGEAAEIHPANLMFRAVRVPAGAHRIEFRYRPASFRYAVALFACGTAATVLLLAWRRIRRNASSRERGS